MPNIQYSESPNVETAFVVQDGGQKNRAVLTAPQDTSTLELPDNPNSTKGYVTIDGKKHKVILTADISGGGSGGGAVSSVNGKTGAVVLDAQDVNAVPQYSTMPEATAQNAGEVAQYVGNTIPEHVEATQTVGTSLSNIQVDSDRFFATGEISKTFTFGNYLSFVFNGKDSDLFDLYVVDPVGLRAAIESQLQRFTDNLDYVISHLIPGDMQQDSGTMFFKSQSGDWILLLQWVGSDSANKQTFVDVNNYLHVDIMGEQTGYWDVYVGSMALTGWNTDLAYYGITYSGIPVADDVISAKTVGTIVHNYFYESTGTEWTRIDVQKGLPDQTDNAGKFLMTDGTDVSWASVSGGIDWDGATEIAYDANNSNYTSVGFDFQNLETGDYYFYIKTMQSVYIVNGPRPVWQTAKVSFHWDSTWTSDGTTDFAASLRVAPVLDGNYMGNSNSYNDLLNGMGYPAACFGISTTSNRIFLTLGNKFNSTAPENGAAQDGDIIQVISKLFGGETPMSMDDIAQAVDPYYTPWPYMTYVEGGNSMPLIPPYNPPTHFASQEQQVSFWAQNNVVAICDSHNNVGGTSVYGVASINFSASFSGGEFDGRIIYAPNGLTTSQITKTTGVFETARFYIQDNVCYLSYDPTLFAALQNQSEIVLLGAWGAGTQSNVWISPNIFNKTGADALKPNNLVPIATGMSSYITDTPTYVNLGGIIQYIGETDANYTNGFFYKANGTVIVVPESATITPVDYNDITVTVDITNLITALMAATGWSRPQVTNNLSNYDWAIDCNFDNNTVTRVYWGYYGSMFQQDILNCFTVSTTGTYIGALYLNCTMVYTPQYNEVQNGSWDRIDVQPTPQASTGTTATLAVNDWVNNEQTVNVTGVTANNIVIVVPAPASSADYTSGGISCTAQSTNSLTFSCQTVPTNAITVNVLILG